MNDKNTLHCCKVSVSYSVFNYLFSSSVMPDLNLKISLSSKTVIFSISLLTICSSYSVTRFVCICRNCRISSIRFLNISCSASLVTKTAFLSSFLLLLNGKEFNEVDSKTKKEIRVARKKAVEEYVNKKISAVSEKKKILEEQLALFDGIDVEQKMQEIIDSIKETEAKISSASAKSREILSQILELQEQAAECNLLQGRYATLRGQYVSDIKRLSFIVNGEVEMKNVAHNTICPFCDGTIPVKNKNTWV